MKAREIRTIQEHLRQKGYDTGDIDGRRTPATDADIETVLAARAGELPDGWPAWPPRRKAVALLRLLCRDRDIDPGPVDGLYGPQTEAASDQLNILTTTGSLPRGFGDIEPVRANPHDFPIERTDDLNARYGRPCEARLIKVRCPWRLRLDWDLATQTSTISIHEQLADSLATVLDQVYDTYGTSEIQRLGLDRYGGSYNCRKKRGSLSAWSTHAWGISIDWFPSRNKLKWNSDRASLAHEDLDPWWEIWEREGWLSLGRSEDRDWMHVQAAKR